MPVASIGANSTFPPLSNYIPLSYAVVDKLDQQHSALVVEEVHGDMEEIAVFMHRYTGRFALFHSPCLDANGNAARSSGGLLCIVNLEVNM